MNSKPSFHTAFDGSGIKPKDQILIPHRVAMALQADGWWLRDTIIWEKGNPMPSSVTDRTTTCHEYIFLLAKNAKYFYDAEAIKEPCVSGPSDIKKMVECADRISGKTLMASDPLYSANMGTHIGQKRGVGDPSGRNKRSVWHVNTRPFRGSHFAVFPEALVSPMILAGTSEKGCCSKCGAPWERVVEKSRYIPPEAKEGERFVDNSRGDKNRKLSGSDYNEQTSTKTIGWEPSCACGEETAPCVVLDPFFGSGTVGVVAKKLGRAYIGVELNPEYISMAEDRIAQVGDNLFKTEIAEKENKPVVGKQDSLF